MELILYKNTSDNNVVTKMLQDETKLTGNLRDEVSVINPTIRITNKTFPNFNYCYIPDFNRYYFITDINIYRTGVYDLSLSVDVLMSFKEQFLELKAIIERQEFNHNNYLVDPNVVTCNKTIIETRNAELNPKLTIGHFDGADGADITSHRYIVVAAGEAKKL